MLCGGGVRVEAVLLRVGLDPTDGGLAILDLGRPLGSARSAGAPSTMAATKSGLNGFMAVNVIVSNSLRRSA